MLSLLWTLEVIRFETNGSFFMCCLVKKKKKIIDLNIDRILMEDCCLVERQSSILMNLKENCKEKENNDKQNKMRLWFGL